METKEAIWYFKNYEDYNKDIFRENIDCILKALRRGEKFEEIVKELKQYCLILERQNVLKEIIRLEQKYFPEEIEK